MKPALTPRFAQVLRAVPAAGARFGAIALGLCLARPVAAADRATEFLNELRQRGWHDVAVEYLETADQDPLATREFLDRVDFEQAVTLAAMAKASVRDSERLDLNRRAIDLFEEFASSHQDSPQRLEALSQAANLLSDQALALLAKADRLPSAAVDQGAMLRAQAREKLDAATEVVASLLSACKTELDEAEQADPDQKQQIIVKQAEARFLAANLLFDNAKTYETASEEANETLEAAAEAFGNLHKDYGDKLVGFYGRLYEGRAQQALGQWDEALECYADIVEQPISAPDFRRLVALAYRYRAECHLATNGTDDAIEECQDWLNDANGDELKEAEWLAVTFRLAEAYQRKVALAEGNAAEKLHDNAKLLFREVAVQPGEFQAAARMAIDAGTADAVAPKDVKTFAEAFAAGRAALERMNSTKLAARLAEENNPDSVAELRQQAERNQAEAQQLLEMSLKLADEDAKLEDLLAARHYLCWIYWEEGRVTDSAVIGEFVARRYPESSFASSAAKVALAAWEKMYFAAKQAGDSGGYESENLASMAELIAKVWPESPEASTAVNLLMQIALADDRLQDAEALLAKLPETNRAAAELTLGGALWTRYLQQSAENPDASDELKERAEQFLASGYDQLSEKSSINPGIATGVLYYVQALLAQRDFQRAVAVLENPTFGPLAVVEGGTLEVQPAFALETYKAALRAYLSVDPPRQEQVEEMMAAFEKAVASNGTDQEQLTRVYLGLGLELQKQIAQLNESGKEEEAQSMAGALEALLAKITSREGAADWKVRGWIAQTYLELGAGLSGEAAQKYLDQAEEVYQAMLNDAAKNADYAPSQLAVLGVRKRLGDALRIQGKYDAAFKRYVGVLREKPNMLDLQQEAATVLQEWGQNEKLSEKLEAAIRGAEPQADKKNLVWGWNRLSAIANQAAQQAKAASRDAERAQKFQDLFFEARYHVAQCRLQAALIATGTERTKQLEAARQNVESMKRLYPDLGGPKWQQAFDELLQQIAGAPST